MLESNLYSYFIYMTWFSNQSHVIQILLLYSIKCLFQYISSIKVKDRFVMHRFSFHFSFFCGENRIDSIYN